MEISLRKIKRYIRWQYRLEARRTTETITNIKFVSLYSIYHTEFIGEKPVSISFAKPKLWVSMIIWFKPQASCRQQTMENCIALSCQMRWRLPCQPSILYWIVFSKMLDSTEKTLTSPVEMEGPNIFQEFFSVMFYLQNSWNISTNFSWCNFPTEDKSRLIQVY